MTDDAERLMEGKRLVMIYEEGATDMLSLVAAEYEWPSEWYFLPELWYRDV